MTQLKSKLTLIYYPVLFTSIGFTILYTLIHWLLFIKTGAAVPKDILRFWMPVILSVILIYLLIRPGILLLRFPYGNLTQRRWAYQLMAWLAIALPAIMAQEGLVKTAGKLTRLDVIGEFNPKKTTPYYQIKHFYIGKNQFAAEFTTGLGGTLGSELIFTAWAVMPIFENISDTTHEECSYWAAVKYSKTILNPFNEAKITAAQTEFSNESFAQFSQTNFQKATFLEFETNPYLLAQFDNAIRKSPIVRYKDAVMMVPHFEPLPQWGKEDFLGILIVWAIAAGVFFLLLLIPTLPEEPEYPIY